MFTHISDFSKARVLVVGDVMLDRYWDGESNRISPEAPVPVVNVKDFDVRLGGAANVALNVIALQANCSLLGIRGQDDSGELLEACLKETTIKSKLITLSQHITTTKLRVLSKHQQLIRLDFENSFDEKSLKKIQMVFEKNIKKSNIVICSDYAKGVLKNIQALIKSAKKHKVPIFIDPKTNDFNCYRGATLLTPNFKEFEAAVGPCKTEKDIVKKARNILKKYHLKALLITRGADGMTLIEKGKEAFHLPTQAREVYDVTGAGDTVIGVLGTAFAAGTNLVDAAVLANVAASIVVKKVGTAVATLHELRRAIQHESDSHFGILTREELRQAILDAKAHDEKVVMTNGCFDILHAGHVQYLEQAKALGDRLVVAVNSDTSVKKLKGKNRPINKLQDRMEVLTALHAVDWVVPFSESTPEKLISQVLPDILIKGGDYKIHEIAGAKAVKKHGGEVKVLNFKKGFSTSNLIEKIKG